MGTMGNARFSSSSELLDLFQKSSLSEKRVSLLRPLVSTLNGPQGPFRSPTRGLATGHTLFSPGTRLSKEVYSESSVSGTQKQPP